MLTKTIDSAFCNKYNSSYENYNSNNRCYCCNRTYSFHVCGHLESGFKLFKIDNGFYPETRQDIESLISIR